MIDRYRLKPTSARRSGKACYYSHKSSQERYKMTTILEKRRSSHANRPRRHRPRTVAHLANR
jgi:hypothetical protein